MAARHKQIGECAGHDQAMGVLFEPAIAHLDETEHSLDDPDRVFDFGSYLRLGAVFRPLTLVHHATLAVSAIDAVLGLGARSLITARWPRYA